MIEERFVELLAKKLSEDLDPSEVEELKFLLANDGECRRQYGFFKDYWIQDQGSYSNSALMFQRIKSKIEIPAELHDIETEPVKINRFSTFWKSVAAALIAGVCFGLFYYPNTSQATRVNNLQAAKTPSRSKSRITLSDESVVTLNSETVLKYPLSFEGPTREVYLSGEAFFDVAKDHKHPFIVHAGKMSIRVLGTVFNVKSYANDEQSETTLIRGAIEVTMADRPADKIILKPHDKLVLKSTTFKKYSRDKRLIAATSDRINTNYALTNLTYLNSNDTTIVETSWVNNKLVFKDEAFDALANQMERWYGVKVKFKNSDAKEYRFTGVFEKESITDALDALKMIESFDYKYKNGTVNIY